MVELIRWANSVPAGAGWGLVVVVGIVCGIGIMKLCALGAYWWANRE